MTLWFSSDMHFGHARIIEYCARPFNSVFAMDKWLVSAWNDVVSDEDDVWVLGDVAMGNLSMSLRCVEQLNGKLRLVVGNHDKPFRREGQARPEWERRYMEAGFLEIHHEPISLNLEGLEVTMSHFPYVGDPHRPERFAEHRPRDIGGWLLHGHVHGRWTQRGRCIDVGVDAWGGRPVEGRTVMSLISAGESDRPPLPWVLPSGTSSLPGE